MITPDPDASRELTRELEPGESILWSGRPRQGVVFRPSDMFVVPFTLMWAGFAFFWESQVVTRGAPLFMMLWGIPFMVIGVYITVGRFFWDARVRAQTFYAVTNTRVIIVAGGMRRSVRSLRLNILPDISLHESSDASGSITFGSSQYGGMMFGSGVFESGLFGSGRTQAPRFDMIRNVREMLGVRPSGNFWSDEQDQHEPRGLHGHHERQIDVR